MSPSPCPWGLRVRELPGCAWGEEQDYLPQRPRERGAKYGRCQRGSQPIHSLSRQMGLVLRSLLSCFIQKPSEPGGSDRRGVWGLSAARLPRSGVLSQASRAGPAGEAVPGLGAGCWVLGSAGGSAGAGWDGCVCRHTGVAGPAVCGLVF